ncbi:MAG: class I SAM-dependent methyltransferase [Lysobacter sp.]|nr:class I SAM-dependent methyltransferase [Lysobacter sp.]
MHWRIKGLLQKTLGVLPWGEPLHYQLQRRFGGMRDPRREILLKIDDWELMAKQLHTVGADIREARLMEVGSGWYPALPLACYLGGAARVYTCDLNRLLKPDLMRLCIGILGEALPRIATACQVPLADVQSRYRHLLAGADAADPADLSDGVIQYRAPADAADPGLEDGAVDIIFSNSVLEHVPPEAIERLHRASLRLLRPGGLIFHSVNCGDHYAYADPKVHQLNYLRFTDRQWAFWNNGFLYQNRLRAHQLVGAARDAGFEMLLDTSRARPQRLQQLQAMTVAPEFAGIPEEKLCITTVDFIGRKPVLS